MTINIEFDNNWEKKDNPKFIYLNNNSGDLNIFSDTAEYINIKLILASCDSEKNLQIRVNGNDYCLTSLKPDYFKKVNFDLILNKGHSVVRFIVTDKKSEEKENFYSSESDYNVAVKDLIITRFETIRII